MNVRYNRFITKKRISPYQQSGRLLRGLRNLKVSHSQVRIQIGMLREAVDKNTRQVVQLRADVYDLQKTSSGD